MKNVSVSLHWRSERKKFSDTIQLATFVPDHYSNASSSNVLMIYKLETLLLKRINYNTDMDK